MKNTVVVVSNRIDATIKERQRDVEFLLFHTILDLSKYIENNPVRAKALYVSADSMTKPTNELTLLYNCTKNIFFNVDEVILIATKDSTDSNIFQYLIDTYKLDTWKLVEGSLTREYISSIIDGSLRETEVDTVRKAVWRVNRADYAKEHIDRSDIAESDYADDITMLAGIEDVTVPEDMDKTGSSLSNIVRIAGIPGFERTAFAFLTGQYLATQGKTIVIESDKEYHLFSDIVTKADIPHLRIDIEELYSTTQEVFERIRKTDYNLICFTVKARIKFDYEFVFNLVYNNMAGTVKYVVKEVSLSSLMEGYPYTIVTANSVPSILNTCEHIGVDDLKQLSIVGISTNQMPCNVNNDNAFASIVRDVLDEPTIQTDLLNLLTLKIGGNYDLHSTLRF